MSFGPACERCGCNSYEGSMDEQPIRCPFCRKFKRRGSREELLEALKEAEHALLASAGFIAGVSILDRAGIDATIRDAVRIVQDV